MRIQGVYQRSSNLEATEHLYYRGLPRVDALDRMQLDLRKRSYDQGQEMRGWKWRVQGRLIRIRATLLWVVMNKNVCNDLNFNALL